MSVTRRLLLAVSLVGALAPAATEAQSEPEGFFTEATDITSDTSGKPAKQRVTGPPAGDGSVLVQIGAARSPPGDSLWDQEIATILVSAYDSNGSGDIDRSAEVAAIPCDVFVTLETAFDRSPLYSSAMRTVYGFPGHLNWIGSSVGFSEVMRAEVDAQWASCTSEEAPAPAPAAVPLPVGTRVKRGPDWKWEDQDGGVGGLGTVVKAPTAQDWARVEWDAGDANTYRWGHSGAFDLVVVAAAGGERIQSGELVRILEVSKEDAYHDRRQTHIGVTCTAGDSISVEEGGWVGGQFHNCSHGKEPYFYKVRVERVAGTVSGTTSDSDLLRAIAATPWTGKASGARAHVLPLLVGTYDTNGSGSIDTSAEVKQIPCSVVVAVRDRYQRGGAFTSPIRAVFGVEEGYGWVGGALGFDESVRQDVDKKMVTCGLE